MWVWFALAKMFVVVDWSDVGDGIVGNKSLGSWLAASGASIGFNDENKLLVLGCIGFAASKTGDWLLVGGPWDSTEGRMDSFRLVSKQKLGNRI